MAKGRQAQETAETMRPMPRPNTMRPMPRPNTKRPMSRPERMFERQQDAYDAAMENIEKNMQKFKDADPTRFGK